MALETEPVSAPAMEDCDRDRQCWICFATDGEEATTPGGHASSWVDPCRCRGTTKWVHVHCLWIWLFDRRSRSAITNKDRCPQCKTPYTVVLPSVSLFTRLSKVLDLYIYRSCPFLAGATLVALSYWSAFVYGALVLVQTLGREATEDVLRNRDPAALLLVLPSIPGLLVLANSLQWQERLLRSLRAVRPTTPGRILSALLPAAVRDQTGSTAHSAYRQPSPGRIVAGALLFPSVAVYVGNRLYGHVESPMRRCLLGGLTAFSVHGAVSLYHKQQNYRLYMNRRILECPHQDAQDGLS